MKSQRKDTRAKQAAASKNAREPETSGGIIGLSDEEHHRQLIRIPSFEEIRNRVKTNLDREMQAIEDRRSLESDSTEKHARRMRGTVHSPIAARRLEAYLETNSIGLTDFVSTAQTTDRTLRNFRKTGRIRRDIFRTIAEKMGTTPKELLKKPE